DFTVTQDKDKDKVLLAWHTDYEADNLGFNVYRESRGTRVKMNKALIAGTALQSKHKDKEQERSSGHTYRFRDKLDSSNAFTQFYLEDVDIAGHKTLHGPVSATAGTINEAANATPLPGLGANGSAIESPAGYGVVRSVALPAPSDKQIKQQQDNAADQGLKIYVTQEGWYRLT